MTAIRITCKQEKQTFTHEVAWLAVGRSSAISKQFSKFISHCCADFAGKLPNVNSGLSHLSHSFLLTIGCLLFRQSHCCTSYSISNGKREFVGPNVDSLDRPVSHSGRSFHWTTAEHFNSFCFFHAVSVNAFTALWVNLFTFFRVRCAHALR